MKKIEKCDVACSWTPLPGLSQTVPPSRTLSPSSVTYFMDGPNPNPSNPSSSSLPLRNLSLQLIILQPPPWSFRQPYLVGLWCSFPQQPLDNSFDLMRRSWACVYRAFIKDVPALGRGGLPQWRHMGTRAGGVGVNKDIAYPKHCFSSPLISLPSGRYIPPLAPCFFFFKFAASLAHHPVQ